MTRRNVRIHQSGKVRIRTQPAHTHSRYEGIRTIYKCIRAQSMRQPGFSPDFRNGVYSHKYCPGNSFGTFIHVATKYLCSLATDFNSNHILLNFHARHTVRHRVLVQELWVRSEFVVSRLHHSFERTMVWDLVALWNLILYYTSQFWRVSPGTRWTIKMRNESRIIQPPALEKYYVQRGREHWLMECQACMPCCFR